MNNLKYLYFCSPNFCEMNKEENPFVVIGHIKPAYFCDRKAESERLIKLLCNNNNVLLKSDRRMGKTGLIQYCFDKPEIKKNYYTFFFDILHTSCLQELVHELGRAIYGQTVSLGRKMALQLAQTLKSLNGKMSFDANTGLPEFSLSLGDIEQPEHTLEEIFQYLQNANRPCIVAIDEFQQIDKYPEKNIEALLRGHIQRVDNCHFIFAGSQRHLLNMMFESEKKPFYKSADNMDLGPIDRGVYVDFITQMFADKGKSIQNDTAGQVYDLFEGHTYYVQKTMNEAFANTSKGGDCDSETLLQSIYNILDSNDLHYREMLSNITIRQKELLYAIAIEGKATQITSASFINRHKLMSASSVQAALKKLTASEIVVEESKQYRISDRFLRLWILRLLGFALPL